MDPVSSNVFGEILIVDTDRRGNQYVCRNTKVRRNTMLKLNICTQALQPMLDWLNAAKKQNVRSEYQLREILHMEDS